jgi:metal-responsive CopG/Arc/MetJ family transcriptional regulator
MRTLIDIPEQQIKDLMVICQSEKLSRAEVIRKAIAYYLEKKKPETVDGIRPLEKSSG